MSPMISSSVNRFEYAASGFSVLCAWFFSLILANSSKSAPPYLWPYSMPIWAKVPGIASVPDASVGGGDGAVATLRRPHLAVGLGRAAATEQAGAGELLDADGDAHVALAGLHRHDDRAQRRGAGGARVRHVVDGDAGLADLLLDLLADAARSHQVAGGHDAHLAHRDAAVGERAHGGFGGEVDDVLVGVLAELRHRDAQDVHVLGHGRLLSVQFSGCDDVEAMMMSSDEGQAGAKPKPMASVPLSSVPSE